MVKVVGLVTVMVWFPMVRVVGLCTGGQYS